MSTKERNTTDAKKAQPKKKAAPRKVASKRATTTRSRSRAKGAKMSPKRLTGVTNTLSLAALSPYRFPIDVERLALHSARIGGFAFVFLGLVFTYNYIESATTDLVVRATQAASVQAAVPCTDTCALVRVTPSVSFSYAQGDQRNEQIISMDVAKAEAVTVYAFDPRSGEYMHLGDAERASGNTWTYEWDTSNVPSGDYWVKAMIENRHGVYDRSDSEYLTVE